MYKHNVTKKFNLYIFNYNQKMNRYTIIGKIGEGAHGLVLKASDNASPIPKIVALKRILLKRIEDGIPVSVLREVKTLQQLKHPYIVELLDAFPAGLDFVMVFEYMPSGLWEMLKDYDKPLRDSHIKIYMKMLLEGVAYMHSNNIMHRDLKPANLLIREDGILTIADFGLGRLMWENNSRPYSHQVATRWYRAPELLYGARFYSSAIDLWSVGCIFGEMLNNSPLFPGDSDIEQLAIVLGHLGSPTAESWPELTSLPDYNKITFPYNKGILWERIIPDAQQEAIDLIKSILIYDSSKRLTAEEALRHEYFYTKPYPCSKMQIIIPPNDHRVRLKPKEVKTNVKSTTLFKNLLNIL
ncbi:PREDICTED: cyclin-dependent kinase 20 [Ceratosolen solmsi marchali]|uniref:Cyclin-dependent kinase 20 n=1 Tax=Ceratosolen solmsi marchali TaxID=326594 RepID=A0AAJ6YTP6_9HYME|nr:PREDICTED: cyclin-dependent kinase 20 [Ceratosolen solmsi marchali]